MPDPKSDFIFSGVRDMQRGSVIGLQNLLRDSDIARRTNVTLQREMLRDPDIKSPLNQRLGAVALLDWNIVPEDAEDPKQVEQAEELSTIISRMRRWHEFVFKLGLATWYGPAAIDVSYTTQDIGGVARVVPSRWMAINSDSIQFDTSGRMGFLVGQSFDGEKVAGPRGQTHMLTDDERAKVVFHVVNQEAPDYEVPEEAGYLYRGRGLRDVCWTFWWMKQQDLQFWQQRLEMSAGGVRLFRYPRGNPEAKEQAEKMARNQGGDTMFLIPVDPVNPDAFGVEIIEPSSLGQFSKDFAAIINDYLGGKMKELIVGQTATTEETSSGLGSDVSKRHAQTFQRIIKMDAFSMADSLTHEFVHYLHEWNFGDTPYRPRFEFVVDEVDPHEVMEGMERAANLGVGLGERQVRDVLGLGEPDQDDRVLAGGSAVDMGLGFGALDFAKIERFRKALK